MAELNYYDIRRAVNEELRTLHSVVVEIRQNQHDIRQQMQQIYLAHQQLQQLIVRLNQIQQQLNGISNMYYNLRSTPASSNFGPVSQSVNQMKTRLSALEDSLRGIVSLISGRPTSESQEEQEQRQTRTS